LEIVPLWLAQSRWKYSSPKVFLHGGQTLLIVQELGSYISSRFFKSIFNGACWFDY
jgi:hypothetical protein